MSNRKFPLIFLIPYLGKYRYRIVLGSLMVACTVVASMFSPWVLKYVIDDLQQLLERDKLLYYAALILGLSALEGFFRFWMRRILMLWIIQETLLKKSGAKNLLYVRSLNESASQTENY